MLLFFGNEVEALEEMERYASQHSNGMFDSRSVFKLVDNTRICALEDTSGILLTPELQVELNNVFDTPPERISWRLAAFLITDAVLEQLSESGIELIGPYGDSDSCS